MTVPVVDGRSARRQRNRLDVVDAMLSLFGEGVLDPSMDELAARAHVSERSIFRYFESLDDLRQAVIRRNFERSKPLLSIHDAGEGALTERVRHFVDARLRLWATIAGAARVARVRAPLVPEIAADVQRFRVLLDEQIRAQFSPELKHCASPLDQDRVSMVAVVTSFDSWDLLVAAYGQSEDEVRRAWLWALLRLLGADQGSAEDDGSDGGCTSVQGVP